MQRETIDTASSKFDCVHCAAPTPNKKLSYCQDSALRLGHSPSRDEGRTDRMLMATVASNTVKECDAKTLLKSFQCDLDAGSW